MSFRSLASIPLLVILAGCEGWVGPAAGGGSDGSQHAAAIIHTFDFASQAPPRLSIMFTMAWFGIPASDPQAPGGADPSYGNWNAGGTPCSIVKSDPTTSDTCILRGANNACLEQDPAGTSHRVIASRRRPITGIWSGTGRDAESDKKLDLMLAMLRRPGCRADDGARLDAWTTQNNTIRFSSKYVANPSANADLPYRTMMALFDRADAAHIANAVMPGFDSTWYFHFGSSVGLGKCDDSSGNPRSSCIDALTSDLRDLALEAKGRFSAVRVAGKPVLFVYTDHWNAIDQHHGGTMPSAAEWQHIFDTARQEAGTDFYVIGVSDGADAFAAFDALAPWLGASSYHASSTIYNDSFAHARARHQALIDGVGAYPGRLVFGGVTPGFDDWTRNWSGPCQERRLPTTSPRDPQFLAAQQDFFTQCKHGVACTAAHSGYDFRGFVGETWDDWTEGSEFEPDVAGGASALVGLRQLIGSVFGDPADPAGDTRLAQRWASYGEARSGTGGAAGVPPVTDLSCDASSAPTIDFAEPAQDSVQAARIHVVAHEVTPQVASAMQVYVDDALAASQNGELLDVDLPALAPGVHRIGVKAWYGGTPGPIEQHFVTVTTDPVAETLPGDGETTAATVHVLARDNAAGVSPIAMQIYLDGVLASQVSAPPLATYNTMLPVGSTGTHRIAVKSWYPDGTNLYTEHAITVSSAPVVETRPADGATVHAPVFVEATSAKPAVAMQVYLDDVMVDQVSGSDQLEAHVPATSGTHRFAVKAWYADGTSSLSAQATVTVQ